jgi:hypothetical protein
VTSKDASNVRDPALLAALDHAVFERCAPHRYALLAPSPPWVEAVVGGACEDGTFDVEGHLPFLEHFAEDASPHWAAQRATPLRCPPLKVARTSCSRG